MKKLPALLIAVCLLTGCGSDIPQNTEDVDTFVDALAFMSGSSETDVTEMIIEFGNGVSAPKTVRVSAEDRESLLSLVEKSAFTFETYERGLTAYGSSSYKVTCTLADSGPVTLTVREDQFKFSRRELGEDEKWHDVYYRLIPGDAAVTEEFYENVCRIWEPVWGVPGEDEQP